MKLKASERSAILAGEYPEIVRPHENGCPFTVGERIVLKSQRSRTGAVPIVTMTITGKHRRDAKTWQPIYKVKDDRGLYLAKGNGYTRSASTSVDWEAPVLDPSAQATYAAQGRLEMAKRRENSQAAIEKQDRAAKSMLLETLSGLEGATRTLFLAEIQRSCQNAKMQGAA